MSKAFVVVKNSGGEDTKKMQTKAFFPPFSFKGVGGAGSCRAYGCFFEGFSWRLWEK